MYAEQLMRRGQQTECVDASFEHAAGDNA